MADYLPLPDSETADTRPARVASLDVFRGLCVFLMMVVDYGGFMFPIITHSPWNGLQLADFVMPFFLFVAGVSLALVYKKVTNRVEATWKAVFRAAKLFLLGVFLQGGYLHGVTSLTYGVDIEKIRWMGILQRISIGYVVAALCEIWLPYRTWREVGFFKGYYWHWCVAFSLSAIYLWLSYALYVPDWQFMVPASASSLPSSNDSYVYTVKCGVRGDLGPGCNSAGMIDRYILGFDHMYMKPGYRNLKECNISANGQVSESSPPWCHAPFDPEGILRWSIKPSSLSYFLRSYILFVSLPIYANLLSLCSADRFCVQHWSLLSYVIANRSSGFLIQILSTCSVEREPWKRRSS